MNRRGIATLEMVLVMPVFLLAALTLLWMGSVGINQVTASVDARYEAWQLRTDQSADPFEFQSASQGEVRVGISRPITVSPLVDDWIIPRSEHVVFAGTWQSPHVDLNRSPNWEVQSRLIAKVPLQQFSGIKQGLGGFQDARVGLRRLPAGVSEQFSAHSLLVDGLKSLAGGVLDANAQATQRAKESQDENNRRAVEAVRRYRRIVQDHKRTAEGNLRKAEQDLEVGERNLKQLQDLLNSEKQKNSPDEEKIEELGADIEAREDKIKTLRNQTIPRLKSGIVDLEQAESNFDIALEKLQN